jgi:hypothetical protein
MKDLTDICEDVLKENDDKEKFLKDQMHKLNKSLPATAYIPILTGAQRNFMVLRVVPDECRLFITATKAPYLVNIEVFQPQELNLFIQTVQAQHKPRAFDIMRNLVSEDHLKIQKKLISELSKPVYPFEQKIKKSELLIMKSNGNGSPRAEFETRKTTYIEDIRNKNIKAKGFNNRPDEVDLLGFEDASQEILNASIDRACVNEHTTVIDYEDELARLSVQRQSIHGSNDPSN